jgi:hypothetical protein
MADQQPARAPLPPIVIAAAPIRHAPDQSCGPPTDGIVPELDGEAIVGAARGSLVDDEVVASLVYGIYRDSYAKAGGSIPPLEVAVVDVVTGGPCRRAEVRSNDPANPPPPYRCEHHVMVDVRTSAIVKDMETLTRL